VDTSTGIKVAQADKKRSDKDLELWNAWKQSNEDPDKLRPLLQQFRGLIRKKSNQWLNKADIPPAAINAEFNKQFLQGLRTYDPNRGTQLKSWVTTNLSKSHRYLTTYQNPARIVETRSSVKKGLFDHALSTLTSDLDREPTTEELSDFLKSAPAEVARAQS